MDLAPVCPPSSPPRREGLKTYFPAVGARTADTRTAVSGALPE